LFDLDDTTKVIVKQLRKENSFSNSLMIEFFISYYMIIIKQLKRIKF